MEVARVPLLRAEDGCSRHQLPDGVLVGVPDGVPPIVLSMSRATEEANLVLEGQTSIDEMLHELGEPPLEQLPSLDYVLGED